MRLNILKISDSKVKIMLSASDAKHYGIDPVALDYKDEETRERIWEILDDAKGGMGFSHDGEKLLIQFYPSKDGGAELFVTRLENLPERSERLLSRANDVAMLEKCFSLYNFESREDLVSLARIINGKSGIGKSDLYFDESDGYFLKIEERGIRKNGVICEFALMLDFSRSVRRDKFPYIREHHKLLIEDNAVESLAMSKK